MKRRIAVAAFFVLCACEARPADPPPHPTPPEQPAPQAATIDFTPIPARLALPTQILAMRLGADPVGTYTDRELANPVPLRAVGLNLCQTGWILQGFLTRDGELAATPPLPIPRATLEVGHTEIRDDDVPGQAIVLDLESASMDLLRGTVRVVPDDGSTDLAHMTIDGAPVGVSVAPGLGAQGCFATGYYQLRLGDEERVGPVSAVWDHRRLYYVGARLTEKYGIGFWLILEPTHRQPQNIIRGELATVAEKPTRFPFRVVFETRTTTDSGVVVEEIEAAAGKVTARFTKANPQGPLRVDIEHLEFPRWDGPLAGLEIDRLRIEAMIVTDLEGVGVPVPSEPTFDHEGQK